MVRVRIRNAAFAPILLALTLAGGDSTPARAKWICTAPDLVQYMHICLGMNPVPVFDAATLAQEALTLARNIEKTASLAAKVVTEAQKLTNLTNLLKLAGNPGDETGASTGLGQMKAIVETLGKEGPASLLTKLLGSVSVPSVPVIEKQIQSKLPQPMAGVNHASLSDVSTKADQLFSFGGTGNSAVTAQRRSYMANEATDAQAASAIAMSNLGTAQQTLKQIEEAVKESKNLREDWQANTKARLALLEAMNTRLALMARINATSASRILVQSGDDADRNASR